MTGGIQHVTDLSCCYYAISGDWLDVLISRFARFVEVNVARSPLWRRWAPCFDGSRTATASSRSHKNTLEQICQAGSMVMYLLEVGTWLPLSTV